MSRYRVTINTSSYRKKRCSKKNWESGTLNDYMEALNGWHTIEKSLREVMWRLMMFQGNDYPMEEYDESNPYEYGLSKRYTKWRNKECNTIKYMDKLCGFERTHIPSGYGFMQGYFNVHAYVDKLRKEGTICIPFKVLYDARQYDKAMDGCYMEITRIKEKGER